MKLDFNRLIQRFIRRFTAPSRLMTSVADAPPLVLLPTTHQQAAQRLVDPAVIKSAKYRARVLSVSEQGSDARIVDFSTAFRKELERRGMPFFAHCYVRGKAEQNALFAKGVTKARYPHSPHNRGMAVDMVHYGRFWDLTKKEWDVLGLIGKEVARKRNIKIEWGGDWKFYDPAHWELRDWESLDFIAWPNKDWRVLPFPYAGLSQPNLF